MAVLNKVEGTVHQKAKAVWKAPKEVAEGCSITLRYVKFILEENSVD